MKQMLVAGSGIGGLAAALACARAGWQVRVLEKAPALEEVGAGIQIGPNVTRVLHRWGLESALAEVAAFPERLQVRNAVTGDVLGALPLGERAQRLYHVAGRNAARFQCAGALGDVGAQLAREGVAVNDLSCHR